MWAVSYILHLLILNALFPSIFVNWLLPVAVAEVLWRFSYKVGEFREIHVFLVKVASLFIAQYAYLILYTLPVVYSGETGDKYSFEWILAGLLAVAQALVLGLSALLVKRPKDGAKGEI